MNHKLRKYIKKGIKWCFAIFFSLILLLLVLIILIRIPWVQQKIVGYVTEYVEEKTATRFTIDRFFLTFDGNVRIEGLLLEDQQQDTLVAFNVFETSVDLLDLFDQKITVNEITTDHLRADIKRTGETFNFQFLIDAFASEDTTSSSDPMVFSIGHVGLYHTNIDFLDSLTGMQYHASPDTLTLAMNSMNLDSLHFDVEQVHCTDGRIRTTFFDAMGDAEQEEKPKETADTSQTYPYVHVGQLKLSRIDYAYRDQGEDTLTAAVQLGSFLQNGVVFDLEHQKIRSESLGLHQTTVDLRLPQSMPEAPAENEDKTAFTWPEWDVQLDDIELSNNNVTAFRKGAEASHLFNPDDVAVNNLSLTIPQVKLDDEAFYMKTTHLALEEKCGFALENLSFNALVDQRRSAVSELKVKTPYNNIHLSIAAMYEGLEEWFNAPDASRYTLQSFTSTLSPEDLKYFIPDVAEASYYTMLSGETVNVDGKIAMTGKKIQTEGVQVDVLQHTRLILTGDVTEWNDTEQMKIDISDIQLSSSKKDIQRIAGADLSLTLPKHVALSGSAKGSMARLTSRLQLRSPMGNVLVQSRWKDLLSQKPGYRGEIQLEGLDVAAFTGQEMISPVTATTTFEGVGFDPHTIELYTSTSFNNLKVQHYTFDTLEVGADMVRDSIAWNLTHKGRDLNTAAKGTLLLQDTTFAAEVDWDIAHADLHALHLTGKSLTMDAGLHARFYGHAEDYEAGLELEKVRFHQDNETYTAEPFSLTLASAVHKTAMTVNSGIANGAMSADCSLTELAEEVIRYIKYKYNPDEQPPEDQPAIIAEASFTAEPSAVLKEVLLPELDSLAPIALDFYFEPKQGMLSGTLNIPGVRYGATQADSVRFSYVSTHDTAQASFMVKRFVNGPVDIHALSLQSGYHHDKIESHLLLQDKEGLEMMNIGVKTALRNDSISWHVLPERLVLNGNPWEVAPTNQFVMTQNKLFFKDFMFTHDKEKVSISDTITNEVSTYHFSFSDFDLETITSLLNTEKAPVDGLLEGNISLSDYQGINGIKADLGVTGMELMDVALGRLDIHLDHTDRYLVEGNARLHGGPANISVEGKADTAGAFSAQTDVKYLDLKLAEKFAGEYLENTSGNLVAALQIEGSAVEFDWKGDIYFQDAGFKVKPVNTAFTLSDERISTTSEDISFHKFTILDEQQHKATIDGKIDIASLINPAFDLHVQANKFLLMNTTKKHHSTYYGKALVGTDAQVKGDLELPEITAKVRLVEGSDITYVVPESEVDMEEGEGLVRFANVRDTLSRKQEEDQPQSEKADITGIDLQSQLLIDKQTRFTVIVDQRTGDKLDVKGSANLAFDLHPGGIMSLSGRYEIVDGAYQINFYNMVKKRFSLVQGGYIDWSGDPYKANLNIKARYQVKTAAYDLMATQLTSADAGVASQYRRPVPFNVLLHIGGALDKPEMSFKLELPEEERDAADGALATRLHQLNQNESELNKQVFSLIVFNKFLPAGVARSDDSGSGMSNMARGSVSRMLSGQLNRMADKYIKDVELNLDLQSYEAGESEGSTSLNVSVRKALFDERFVVEVGSQVDLEGDQQAGRQQNDIVGDVSLEYLLNEKGSYRMRAFRKNHFKDIVEGQVIITGLSVLFNKDFNKVNELFRSEDKEEEEQGE